MNLSYDKIENSIIGSELINNFESEAAAVGNCSHSIANSYKNTSTYAVGSYCIYNYRLYKCTTAVTEAEDFDATKWTKTNVMAEIKSAGSSGYVMSVFEGVAPSGDTAPLSADYDLVLSDCSDVNMIFPLSACIYDADGVCHDISAFESDIEPVYVCVSGGKLHLHLVTSEAVASYAGKAYRVVVAYPMVSESVSGDVDEDETGSGSSSSGSSGSGSSSGDSSGTGSGSSGSGDSSGTGSGSSGSGDSSGTTIDTSLFAPLTCIASTYDTSSSYKFGDHCTYNGDLYICVSDSVVSGDFSSDAWQKTTIATWNDCILGLIADEYVSGNTYMKYQYCLHNGSLYQCTVDKSSKTFVSDEWCEYSIGDVLYRLDWLNWTEELGSKTNYQVSNQHVIGGFYNKDASYKAGEFVLRTVISENENVPDYYYLYKALSDIEAGSDFNETLWSKTSICDELYSLGWNINNIASNVSVLSEKVTSLSDKVNSLGSGSSSGSSDSNAYGGYGAAVVFPYVFDCSSIDASSLSYPYSMNIPVMSVDRMGVVCDGDIKPCVVAVSGVKASDTQNQYRVPFVTPVSSSSYYNSVKYTKTVVYGSYYYNRSDNLYIDVIIPDESEWMSKYIIWIAGVKS